MTKQQITNLLTLARKAKDTLSISVYGDILSRIGNQEIALKKLDLSEDEIVSVIKKAAAEREESILAFQKAGRTESMNKELDEWTVLNKHIPKMFNREESEELIDAAIIELGATSKKQMGAIIGHLKKLHGNKLDMKLASSILGAKLT